MLRPSVGGSAGVLIGQPLMRVWYIMTRIQTSNHFACQRRCCGLHLDLSEIASCYIKACIAQQIVDVACGAHHARREGRSVGTFWRAAQTCTSQAT